VDGFHRCLQKSGPGARSFPAPAYFVFDVWSTLELCVLFEVGLVIVLDWFAVTPLFTVWLPLPT